MRHAPLKPRAIGPARTLYRCFIAAAAVTSACGCMVSAPAAHGDSRQISVHEILADIPVSPRAVNLTSTPIALCGEHLIVVSVEEGPEPDASRLLTVVRRGESDGSGHWQRIVIEPRTLPDAYHTQPSVGVDRRGHVHVAYNMHNMPWQYSVSRRPCRIDELEFRGEAVTDAELYTVFELNRTPFPGPGRAAIPGNQITYPVFTNDRRGELYVSYRFAVRPARAWLERAFAAGIAHFDDETQTWHPVGGAVALSSLDVDSQAESIQAFPFAWQPGWTAYYPRLWFDVHNGMHVVWTWREKEAGVDTVDPSYALRRGTAAFERADGSVYTLPIELADAGVVSVPDRARFYAGVSVTTNDAGEPLVVVQPVGASRLIARFDRTSQRWLTEPAPYGATSVLCDDDGDCWAYASGPRVLLRSKDSDAWRLVYSEQQFCDPKPLHDARSRRRFLYMTRCDQRSARVIELTG